MSLEAFASDMATEAVNIVGSRVFNERLVGVVTGNAGQAVIATPPAGAGLKPRRGKSQLEDPFDPGERSVH